MNRETLKPIQQPCKTCTHYNGGMCPVGGEVKPNWTGCIVWKPVSPAKEKKGTP